jgi:predicted amidohydrolase YtcJ
MAEPADFLFVDGPVFDGERWVEAPLAVSGERVAVLGPEALDLRGPQTRVVSLAGRCLLPGFHDAHTHFLGGALTAERIDPSGVKSSAELAALVADWIAARPEERAAGTLWVTGRGWDADHFPGGAWPERADLDRVAPDVPVILRRRDGHAAIANGAALARAGIDRDRPDPPGGRILRDASGEPTGILLETAIDVIREAIPAPDRATKLRALRGALGTASALGITSIQDDPSYDDRLKAGPLYAELFESGELPLRVSIWRRLGREHGDLHAEAAALVSSRLRNHVRYGMLKGYLDGSLGSRTAHLWEPYCDREACSVAAEDCGVDLDEAGVLLEHVVAAHRGGFQVGLHAIGDRALSRGLDAFAAAGPPEELRARRHRIEHAQLFREGDVERLAAQGTVASVQPIHLASDLVIARERLGEERCKNAYPWASLEQAGARIAFGTDWPIEPLAPLDGLYTALARQAPPSRGLPPEPFHSEQALSLESALRAYTLGSAEAAHQEDRLGRLAPDYYADLVVLSADLRALAPSELPEQRVELTLRGGEVVFEAS